MNLPEMVLMTAYFARINNKKPFVLIEAKTFPTVYFKKGDPFIEEIMKTGVRD
jgi:hypothetical protein